MLTFLGVVRVIIVVEPLAGVKTCTVKTVIMVNSSIHVSSFSLRYNYLGILELDTIKENEMKKKFGDEYLRRFRLVRKSRLNGKNKIKAAKTWAVSLMRYGAGILKWTNKELKE